MTSKTTRLRRPLSATADRAVDADSQHGAVTGEDDCIARPGVGGLNKAVRSPLATSQCRAEPSSEARRSRLPSSDTPLSLAYVEAYEAYRLVEFPPLMPLFSVNHLTVYRYRRPVRFGEYVLMFRPRQLRSAAPGCIAPCQPGAGNHSLDP